MSQHYGVRGSTGFRADTLAIVWNKHAAGLSARTKINPRLLILHFFMVFVYMEHLPISSSWSGQMAFMKHGNRKKYSKARFWKHARPIVAYLSEHIDELELTARDDPYNHGTGEMAVGAKEIVDTFPVKILSRDVKHQNPKYGAFVLKFQVMCTFTGRIAASRGCRRLTAGASGTRASSTSNTTARTTSSWATRRTSGATCASRRRRAASPTTSACATST